MISRNILNFLLLILIASCAKKNKQNPNIIPGENRIISYNVAIEAFKDVSPDRVVHTIVVPFGLKSNIKIYECPNHQCFGDAEYLLSCINHSSINCEVKVFNGQDFQLAGLSAYSRKGSSNSGVLEIKIVDPFNSRVPNDPFAVESINSEARVSNRVFSK